MLEGEHHVGDDRVFIDPLEFVVRVDTGMLYDFRRASGFRIAGWVGGAEGDSSVSIASATYRNAETVCCQFGRFEVDALGALGGA